MLGETSNRGERHVTDMRRTTLRALLVAAAIGLAVGALGGLAAADHAGDSKIDSNTSVTVNDEGGYFHVLCTGSPTEHDCDKSGELDAGPASVDYEGFNNDSLQNRSSRFGDTFVVTVDGEEYTVSFTCDLSDDPPEDNPCPVDPPGDDGGDGEADDARDDRRKNNRSPDHANGP
jgi:hypothetical protein